MKIFEETAIQTKIYGLSEGQDFPLQRKVAPENLQTRLTLLQYYMSYVTLRL